MKEMDLRKWHRLISIWVGPLIILQALSGIILSIDWLLEIHRRFGEMIRENTPLNARLWDAILVKIHYGIGKTGAFYHIALGGAAIWVAVSGIIIFLRMRNRQRAALRKSQSDARNNT